MCDSLDIDERVTPFRDLGEFFERIGEADANNEYVVAWLDQLASGNRAGRGLLMTGNHARHGARTAARAGSRLAVPFQPPFNLLNRPFLKLFNTAYRIRKGGAKPKGAVPYQGFFFPLDGVRDWNRLYGPTRPLPASERGAGTDARAPRSQTCSTSRAGPGRGRS